MVPRVVGELPRLGQLTVKDLFAAYATPNSDARKITARILLAYMQANIDFGTLGIGQFWSQYAVPSSTGFSVTITPRAAGGNTHLILTPTAEFAEGTIVLPDVATVADKQLVLINSTQSLTSLTIDGNGAASVIGAPTTLVENDAFFGKFDKPTLTWYFFRFSEEIPTECSPLSAGLSAEYDYSALQVIGDFHSITMSPDGTRLYASDNAGGTLAQGISQYALSTAWDVSTSTHVAHKAESGGVPGGAGFPNGIYIHPDGGRIFCIDSYITGTISPKIQGIAEYSLSTPWDITTLSADPVATYQTHNDVDITPLDLSFSADGLFFYTGDNTTNAAAFHQWQLSTAWDITTANYNGSVDLTTVAGFPATNYLVRSISVDEAGRNLLVAQGSGGLYVLNLAVAHDISTISYTRSLTLSGTSAIFGIVSNEECIDLIVSSPLTKEFASYTIST